MLIVHIHTEVKRQMLTAVSGLCFLVQVNRVGNSRLNSNNIRRSQLVTAGSLLFANEYAIRRVVSCCLGLNSSKCKSLSEIIIGAGGK